MAAQRRVIAEISSERHVTGADVLRVIGGSDAVKVAVLRKVARDIAFWDPDAKVAASALADRIEEEIYAPLGGVVHIKEGDTLYHVPVTRALLSALRSGSEEEITLAIEKSKATPIKIDKA